MRPVCPLFARSSARTPSFIRTADVVHSRRRSLRRWRAARRIRCADQSAPDSVQNQRHRGLTHAPPARAAPPCPLLPRIATPPAPTPAPARLATPPAHSLTSLTISNHPQALDRWEERLEAIFEGRPYDNLDAALTDTVNRFPVEIQPFRDMIDGMRSDLVKPRYHTYDELYKYCYQVAGTVALMVMPVMGMDPNYKVRTQRTRRGPFAGHSTPAPERAADRHVQWHLCAKTSCKQHSFNAPPRHSCLALVPCTPHSCVATHL